VLRAPRNVSVLTLSIPDDRPMSASQKSKHATWRQRVYEVLDHGPVGDRREQYVSRFLIVLVLVNVAAIVFESVPRYEAEYGGLFLGIEIFSLVVFTIEYALRIWVAAEHAPYRHFTPTRARLSYMLSVNGMIDLVSALPFWLAFVVPAEFRVILLLRIVRFLKLARYSPAMRSLLEALYAERRALIGCLFILFGATLVAAAFMHLAERNAQPDKFGTIPDAMWWAIVTLGTIGYGDVVPITPIGKMIAAATIICGLVMIALPVGIIATAFSDQIHRRDFVVTWSMVARVPLFHGLDATSIAQIMRLLRAQTANAGDIIVRRGDAAQSMYFIATGEVAVEIDGQQHTTLGVGQFFGEIAILRRARRSATVRAVTRTNLLVLDATDFHDLMEQEPRISERVHTVVRDRLGREMVTPRGDMVTEELSTPGDD
jgi:voltage-gated potassium channel